MDEATAGPARGGGAEEIETSGSEKLLAVVLAIFIGVGAIWAYERLDHVDRPTDPYPIPTAQEDRAAVELHRRAAVAKRRAARDRFRAVQALELQREAYRTALDAGEPAAELRQQYVTAQVELAAAKAALQDARRAERSTAPAAAAAQRQIEQARSASMQRFDREQRSHDRLVFALRLALLVVLLVASYTLLGRLRSRHSRYLPTAFALIAAAAAVALVMAADYTGDYIEFAAVGPLAISLAGTALTLIAFVALQRYLRRRLPLRRVRRGDCPFCGYPVRSGEHCEGCGRQVVASCSTCQQPRRVGAPRCAACGNA
jgi:hypothetical protein